MDSRALSLVLRISRETGTGVVWVKAGLLALFVHVSGIRTNIWWIWGVSSWTMVRSWLSWVDPSACSDSWVNVIISALREEIPKVGGGGGRNAWMVAVPRVIYSSLSAWDNTMSLVVPVCM